MPARPHAYGRAVANSVSSASADLAIGKHGGNLIPAGSRSEDCSRARLPPGSRVGAVRANEGRLLVRHLVLADESAQQAPSN